MDERAVEGGLEISALLAALAAACRACRSRCRSTGSNTPATTRSIRAPLPAGSFHNPILAGFYPDPSITRVGDKFYLVNSTFAHFPGIPIHESNDLVHWQLIGHALTDPAKLSFDGLGVSRGVFAPSIHFHDGTFYIINTLVDAGGNFFVTAKNPAGPWSDPVWLQGDRRHRSVVLLRRRRQGLRPQQRAARRPAALPGPSRHLDPAVRRGGGQAHRPAQGHRQWRRRYFEEADLDRRPAPVSHQGLVLPDVRRGRHRAGHSEVIFRGTFAVGTVRAVRGQSDPHAAGSAAGPAERRSRTRATRISSR